jgi:N-acyl-D-amino-acid deacylase
MFDLLIRNGCVVDGSGDTIPFKPWYKADIGVIDGKIAKIGVISCSQANEIIDASNLVVCPGIIDIHTHSDYTILVNPKAESKIRQGVTTEVIGSCGFGSAPLLKEGKKVAIETAGLYDLDIDWSTTEDYINKVNDQGTSQNIIPMIGHVNLRASVMGFDSRRPSSDEMDEMKALLDQGMKEGAWGMSTGLISQPSMFAEKEELINLKKVVATHDGVCKTHMRGGGDRVFAALIEALETAKASGVRLIIHHHKAMGDRNSPKVLVTLPLIEKYIMQGVDVYMDMYPYTSGQANLWAALPPWSREGGLEKLVERLNDPELRFRIKMEMMEPMLVPEWKSYYAQTGPDFWSVCRIVACRREYNKWMQGKTLSEAKPSWKDPFDFMFDLLIDEEGNVPFILPDVVKQGDEYLRVVLRHPRTMFGSDGYGLDDYSKLSRWAHPHPRSFGTFPRIFKRYVKRTRDFTWSEAIRKMTSLPAHVLNFRDRGLIREGMYADILIFDPNRIADRATLNNPREYPVGIMYVIVNGKVVLKDIEYTGALPGMCLKHISSTLEK